MLSSLQNLLLFAWQDAPTGEAAPGGGGGDFFSNPMFPMMLCLFAFFLLMSMGDRKKRKEDQARIASLKKNDKVLTIGGIYGIVANVKPGEDDIVLKIDEDKDVKIKVTKSSIARVVSVASEG